MPTSPTQFVAALRQIADPSAIADVSRFFRADANGHSSDNRILGVSIGKIFPVAKQVRRYVVGRYLSDKSRAPLYKLARSRNPWERRTAIVSTYYFIRENDVEDTFRIAELLAHGPHDLVQKAVGSWLREAGKKNQKRLLAFLRNHARSMPRTMVRYAAENLPALARSKYVSMVSRTGARFGAA